MARPSKLTNELIESIAKEVEEGVPFIYVADLFGITRMSWSNWMKQGEYDFENLKETLEAEFFYTVRKAYAKFVKAQGKIIRAGAEGWAGAAWWLERTNRIQFAKDNDNDSANEPVIVKPAVTKEVKQWN